MATAFARMDLDWAKKRLDEDAGEIFSIGKTAPKPPSLGLLPAKSPQANPLCCLADNCLKTFFPQPEKSRIFALFADFALFQTTFLKLFAFFCGFRA